jgi:hypothetical protein
MDVTRSGNVGIFQLVLPDISLLRLHSDLQGFTTSVGLEAVRLLCMFPLLSASQKTKRQLYAVKEELM